MINKKTTMCLFIILILMMLGVSVVSAEDVTNHTSTEPSTNTVTHQEFKKINTQKEVTTNKNEITYTNTATNNTTKSIKKVASQTQKVKNSEAPSTDGYNLHQISSESEFTRQGAKEYYNLTNDIIFTTSSNGNAFQVSSGDDIIINGNGHTISYSGTNSVHFYSLISDTKVTLYNVCFENFTDSVLYSIEAVRTRGPGDVNIINCKFINNYNPNNDIYGGGGAIMLAYVGTAYGIMNITDSDFINNSANRGGAVFYNDPVNLHMTNCYFTNNTALGTSRVDENGGGAVYAEDGSAVNLIRCTFENNKFNRSGVIEENNIAVQGATDVVGYNICVNGIYVTNLTNTTLGIYHKGTTGQLKNNGFKGDVRTYNTHTIFEGVNTTINNTIRYTLKPVEEGFSSGLGNYPIHINFTGTDNIKQSFDRITDDDGYVYFDYLSQNAGTVLFEVVIDEYYNDVLRAQGLVNEKIYSSSTSTETFTIYRVNTTTTSSGGNSLNGKAYSSKDFTINVVDANGHPVTDGNVSLIDANGVNQTKSVENGEVIFTYNFTHTGDYSLTFNYTGTELVYNNSMVTVSANIDSVDSGMTMDIPNDISVLEPLTINVTLENLDGDLDLSNQPVRVYINDQEVEGSPFVTNESGMVQVTYTPVNNEDITVKVVYEGTVDIKSSEKTQTIPGSSIRLVDTVIGADYNGNATIDEDYVITVNLTGNGKLIDPSNITVKLGTDPIDPSMVNVDTENKLLTITIHPSEVRPYNFELSYNGLSGVYNPAESKSFTVNVNLIPVRVFVDYAEVDPESVILMIKFLDPDDNPINEGVFHVNMNNSEAERQDFDTQNLNDPSYKWPVTVDEHGTYYIDVGSRFYREDGFPYAFVTFNGTSKYARSTARKGEMEVKTEIYIDVNTYEDSDFTKRNTTFYIGDDVYIHLDLLNNLGFKQNGDLNLTVYNNKYPEQAVFYSTEHSSNTYGFTKIFNNMTDGEYTIIVGYKGSGAYNPSLATRTFTLLKLESNSIVEVKNNTAGNVTLGVKVTGKNDEPIKQGKITVEVDGVPRVVEYNLGDDEDEVIINLNDLGIGIRTTDPVDIKVTYQGDDKYSSSEAIDKESIEQGNPTVLSSITPDKGTSLISVNVEPENVTVGSKLEVYGTLTDVDGSPINGGNVNVTIKDNDGNIIFSENVTTNNRGYYNLSKLVDQDTYPAGEYTLEVSFADNDHETKTVTQDFNINKVSTNVEVIPLNTTVGNLTVRVMVTDEDGRPIKEGTVNITDANGETIKTVTLDGTSSYVDVVIDSVNSKNPGSLIVNYNGTPRYADASNTDALRDLELSTRGLNINATVTNNTYGNTTILVNVTDTTTGNGISGIEFNITNSSGDVVGTGVTGTDGTVTVKVDVPVGADQKLTVVFPEGSDTYTAKEEEFTVSVEPREAKVDVELEGTTAGEVNVKVTLSDLENGNAITNGTIIIKDNGVVVAEYPFSDVASGIVTVPTSINDATVEHNLEVTFTGNTDYADKTVTDPSLTGFTVDARTATVTASQGNTTIGNMTFVVNVKDGDIPVSNATVNIIVDDTVIATGVTDANGNLEIPADLELDTTSVIVQFAGNSTYKEVNETVTGLTFTKRDTNINASLLSSVAGNVTVRVNVTDATTGEALTEGSIVIVDGEGHEVARIPVPSDNTGAIDVTTNIVDAGSTSLTVKYEGTDVYKDVTFNDEEGIFSFNVEKRNVTIETNIIDSTFNNTIVEVKVLDKINGSGVGNGIVTVYADAEHTKPVGSLETDENGVATITLTDLPVDAENIYIEYADKANTYNGFNTSESISVEPRLVNINATVSNTTAGNVTVKVNITDVLTGETVKMGKFNITSNGKVVASVDLSSDDLVYDENGLLVVPTNITDVLTYTLSVTYNGTPEYEAETYQLESFTATYKESELLTSIPNTTRGNTTLYANLTDPVTGQPLEGSVYVSIDGGKNVEYPLTDGKLEELLDLPVGEHTVTILYNGNNTYAESTKTITLEVKPRNVTISAEFTNTTVGNVTIQVTAVDKETGIGVNGTVNVTLPDNTVVQVEVVDGIGTKVLDIPMNDETPQGVSIKYLEDENYPETILEDPVTLTVTKRESEVTAELVNKDAGNTTVKVTVADPVTGEPITSGTIIITDDGIEVAHIDFEDETGVIEVLTNITSSGPHKLNVTFTGNINYSDANYTDSQLQNVDVANRTASMTITPVNNTFNNTIVNVTIVDSVTGTGIPEGLIEVYNGTTRVGYGTTDENGTVSIKFDVPVDATEVTIKYVGNESNYDPLEETYTFNVEPRSVDVKAIVSNSTAGNVTVKVNLTDSTTGDKVTSGKINITDNRGNVIAEVDLENDDLVFDEDGLLVIVTDINETGRVRLTVNYDGQPEYGEESITTAFMDIEPKEAQLTLSIPETTKGNTTVNVTLVDPVTGEKLNGTVTVYVNGTPVDTIKVVEGEGGKLIDLPVGDSTVKVVFDGNEKYGRSEDETSEPITVNPREIDVKTAITNTTVGNITIEVNVTDKETGAGITGTVNVTLPNGTNVTVDVVDGKGSAVLDIPIADTGKPVTVTYPADGTNDETRIVTDPITISKRDSSVEAEVTSPVANKTEVTVKVCDPVTGEPITSGDVTVKIGDEVIGSLPVGSDGTVVVPVDLPTKGTYNLNVTYEGNENYTSFTTELENVEVVGSESKFIVDVVNATQGNVTVKVNLTDPVTGEQLPITEVNVTLPNGDKQVFPISEDGTITVPLDVGDNTITISYPGDSTYNETEKSLTVNVSPREAVIDALVSNKTAGNITVKVNVTDATTGKGLTNGKVNITLNGEVVGTIDLSTAVPAEDGSIEITTNIQETGKYTLTVEFSHNENYTDTYKNLESFDSTAKESNITAELTNKTKGNTTLDVTFVDPVTGELLNGTVYVIVNGEEPGMPVPIKDGKPVSEVLLDLPVGDNTVEVRFKGDNKYNATSMMFTETVEPREIVVKADFTNTTQGNITLEVNVTDATTGTGITGTVNVTLPNGTNVTVDVVDGKGSAVLDIPIADTGKPVTVTYPADGTNDETRIVTDPITISKRDSSVEAEVTSPVANKTEVTVKVCDPVTGEPITSGDVTVKIGDEVIGSLPVGSDGTVVVPVDLPTIGTYNLNVTYEGNENYTGFTKEITGIEIMGSASELNVDLVNTTQGNVTVKVNLTDPVTGEQLPITEVNVTLPNGDKQVFPISEDGTITVPLDVGDNTITISYPGDDTYNKTSITVNVKVEPRAMNIIAEVINKTAGNITVKVNVTDATTGLPVTSGKVNITLGGTVVGEADIQEDGTAIVYTDIQTTGRYTLTAIVGGNENYTDSYENIESFDSTPKESQIQANVPNTIKGNTTVNVTFVDPVTGEGLTGTVYVSVNGSKKVPVEVTSGKGEIPVDLVVGDYTINVTFDGDQKYNATSFSFPVTVQPREIDLSYEITNHTQGNVTIKVTVNDTETDEGINGTVIVDVDGIPIEVEIVNGEGTAVLDIPVTGGTISVSYPADDTYKEIPAGQPEQVNVNPRESNITAVPGNTSAGNTSVIVTLRDPVTDEPITSGTIIITDNGKEVAKIDYTSETGVVEVPTNITTSGKHNLTVTFEGNENYTDASYTDDALSSINIANRTANITVTPNNTTVGNTTIDVTVVDNATGKALPAGGIVEVYDEKGNKVGEGILGEEGTVTVPVDVPVDTTKVTVKYLGNSTSYDPAIVDFEELSLNPRTSNVEATVTNTTAGNITVKVNVTDATTGKPVTSGTVNITLNGKVVGTANIPEDLQEDGTVIIYTDINETGNYKLVAKYSGDENYTAETFTTESFDAIPKESNVTASIPNTTKGNTTIEISVADPVTGEGLNGTVIVTLPNGTDVPVKVEDGTGSMLLDLPVGSNTITVKYPSNSKYDEDMTTIEVEVLPRSIIVNATLTNTTQGNITLEVNVTDNETGVGVNGTVEVTLPNGTVVPVKVEDGKASVVLDIPIDDTTGQPLQVRYPADGEYNETLIETSNSLTINKRDSNVTARVNPTVAGKTHVIVEVRDPVTGNPITSGIVNVTIGDKQVGSLPVGPDGSVEIPVNIAQKGTYDINVNFQGNENYTGDTTILSGVTIEGSTTQFNTSIVNATNGNVTIKVDLIDPVTNETLPLSEVTVTLPDGTNKTVPVKSDGTITVPLDVGKQNITITYPGDNTYNGTSQTVNVTVEPRATKLDVEVTNKTAGNTTVKVKVTDPETGKPVTTGNVTVRANDEIVGTLPVGPDGTVTIPTSIGSTGTIPLEVTYEGNENYNKTSKQLDPITVLPKESKISAELTNNTRGNTSISIKLVDPVTGEGLNGTVTVTLPNGTNMPVKVTNGEAAVPVDIPSGDNTLKVTYLGNNTYDSYHIDVPVSVAKRDTNISSKVVNTTAGSVTLKTSVKDVTTGKALTDGRVVAILDGKVVGTAEVDSKGNAVITTDITKSGDYDIVLKYEGNPDYDTSNTTIDNLTVKPRQSKVNVKVADNTVGETKVNITMVDPATKKPLNGEVIVTLPDGTNMTTNVENGNIILPVELPAGNSEITVTYPGNDTYDDVVVTLPVKVNKRQTKATAKELTGEAGNVAVEVNVVDNATGEPVSSGEVIINVGGKEVGRAKVNKGVAIVDTNIAKAGNYKLDIKYAGTPEYASTKTSLTEKVTPRQVNVDVKVLNNTVTDTKLEVTVTDSKTGKAVPNETVSVTLPNGTSIKVTTDKKGKAIIKTEASSGNNTIKVKVNGNDVFNSSTTTINTSVDKVKVKLVVDSVVGIVGEKITLTAHVTDEYGKAVTGGNLVFKLNGRTLQTDGRFDTTTNKALKLKVVNGKVTYTLTADLYLRAGKNITASYSGSYKYESAKGNVAEANIKKRTAQVSVTTSPTLVKQDKNIVFKATIKDVTSGSTKSLVNNNAYVLFKINGKTLKDSKGHNIKVKVTKGVAKYTYHVPLGTSGMNNNHKRDYFVTAVYASDIYYPDARDSVAYNVERSSTKINITSAVVKNGKLSVKAKILDQYGKNVVGKNSIAIKINGKTFKVNGKPYTTVNNGNINIKDLNLKGNKVKSLTIVTGERQSYYESTTTTKKVKAS